MSNRNYDVEGVARLEKKIDKVDEELTKIGNSLTKIEEQLTSSNRINELQMKHFADDQAEQWKQIEKNEERINQYDSNNVLARVSNIEQWFKWIALLVFGAIATGILNLIIK